MANYPQELAQDAVCQSHTGHMTGLWFLPTRPVRLNTNVCINVCMRTDMAWNSALTQFFRLHYGPAVDSASNRNGYQEYFVGVKVAGAWG